VPATNSLAPPFAHRDGDLAVVGDLFEDVRVDLVFEEVEVGDVDRLDGVAVDAPLPRNRIASVRQGA